MRRGGNFRWFSQRSISTRGYLPDVPAFPIGLFGGAVYVFLSIERFRWVRSSFRPYCGCLDCVARCGGSRRGSRATGVAGSGSPGWGGPRMEPTLLVFAFLGSFLRHLCLQKKVKFISGVATVKTRFWLGGKEAREDSCPKMMSVSLKELQDRRFLRGCRQEAWLT